MPYLFNLLPFKANKHQYSGEHGGYLFLIKKY